MKRRLAAILTVDAVGYSRLMSEDEEATLATLRSHRELIEKFVAEFDGRVFSGAGDSLLAEFSSPVQAVRCAVRFQEALEVRNAELPEARRMFFRVGINLGDVMVEDGNLFGDSVNIAARLESLAAAGGICISDNVYQQIRNKVQLRYQPLGKHSVKNIAEPIVVYSLLAKPEAGRSIVSRIATRTTRHPVAAGIVVLVVVCSGALITWFGMTRVDTPRQEPVAFPEIARPTRHFKVKRPADLDDADALTVYDRIVPEMVAAYRKSGNPYAEIYSGWRRYNTTPYFSAKHGNRYVNNYANARARAYGKAEQAGTLPEGAVVAKDSFEVTGHGDVLTGPLGLMEKMERGFNPKSRDWRYTMILPNGTLFGTTKGQNSERVEFCIDCHIVAGEAQDHLFFVPEKYRAQFLNLEE